MTVGRILRVINRESIDGKCFIGPRNISRRDQEIQWAVEELNLKGLFVQVDYEDEIVITEEADHWPWEYPKYNKETHTERTWRSIYRFLELMVSMNKVYEERTWRQFKERAIGFRYRSVLEKRILELPEELQIKIVSKLWNSGQNGIGVLDQGATQHRGFHYEQESLLYNLYFKKVMVPRYGGIRVI